MKALTLIALTALASFAASSCASTKPPAEVDVWSVSNYEVTCDMVGTEGIQTMMVASFGSDVDQALMQARWNAIHAILFKGLQTNVCKAPPLVAFEDYRNAEHWFESFLGPERGYLDFIAVASDVPLDMVHVKGGVKVFSQVAVNRNGLRQRLVEAGIIKDLGNVFERKGNG